MNYGSGSFTYDTTVGHPLAEAINGPFWAEVLENWCIRFMLGGSRKSVRIVTSLNSPERFQIQVVSSGGKNPELQVHLLVALTPIFMT